MSAEVEIRPTTYAEWYALEEERDRLRAELETARAALVEQIEARQVTEAEGGALQQMNNEIDRLQAELSRLRSAPVAVEVPELSFWKHANGKWFCWDGYANTEMTPSRILKEGEIHGTPEDLAAIAEGAGWEWIRSHIGGKILVDYMADALRSRKEGAA